MQHPPPPGIIVQQASLAYQAQALFAGLNFEAKAGETTCILGPSGVGKSSLLRMLAGLLPVKKVQRLCATDNLPLASRIAFMAQNDSLLPWLNVLNNVQVGARLRKQKDRGNQARAEQLLQQVGLSEAAALFPRQLSGGMRQRLALARTLFEDKPVVLMDEPFCALDVITRYRLQTLSGELLRDKTVVFISHDPMAALRLADTIFVMAGRPAKLGEAMRLHDATPRDIESVAVKKHYAHLLKQLTAADAATCQTHENTFS